MSSPRRGGVPRYLHLFALSAFAFAAPLLAKLGPAPGYFAAHRMTSTEVALFALGLLVVPPLILILLEAVTGIFGRRVRWVVHLVLVAALTALIVLPPLGSIASFAAYALAALIGFGFTVLYARHRAVRTFASLLLIGPVLFGAWFLFASPASEMVFGTQSDAWRADDSFRPPIVFIQFDALPSLLLETPDRKVDAVRFPNFAKLARDGVWYRNASNVHENTVFSVPTFVDGKLPRLGSTPTVQDHNPNLFTVLGPEYRMNVVEEATSLCPYEYCRHTQRDTGSLWADTRVLFNQIIRPKSERDGLPSIRHRWDDYDAGPLQSRYVTRKKTPEYVLRHLRSGRIGRFERWLAKVSGGGQRPQLNYIHAFLPHEPREYIPDGRRYDTPDDALGTPASYDDRFLSEQMEQRTILQLGFTDRVVGQVLDKLKRQGIYDDAFVVVVADHGESFVPPKATPAGPFVPGHLGYRRAVTSRNVEDIASIPMFIKYPKGHGPSGTDDRYVRSVDVFPTIADELGYDLPDIAGRDLQDRSYKGYDQVQVAKTYGGFVRMSARRWQVARDRSLKRRLDLFGSGHESVYRGGPFAEMVGKPVTNFEVLTATEPHATLVRAGRFDNVNPVAPVCLCQLGGRIESPTTGGTPVVLPTSTTGGTTGPALITNPQGMPIAVAINGKIAATGTGFAARGAKKLNWSVMVPPTAYKDGNNDVAIYQIQGKTKLARIGP